MINIENKENISLMGKIIKRETVNFMKLKEEKNLDEKFKRDTDNWKISEGDYITYSVRRVKVKHLEMGFMIPKDYKNNKVILQLHGGGYEKSLLNYNLYFSKYYMKIANVAVLTPNYRVSPKYKFPAALEDATLAYKWLLKNGYKPEDIIIAGDSAGGGLALATTMVIRKNKLGMPKAIITMSAWNDLTCTSESYAKYKELDPIFGHIEKPLIYKSRYAEGMDKKNPYISPLYGTFEKFPDMLMQVGSCEMLLSDTKIVYEKVKKENVNITMTIYDGMFHVFQGYKGILKEANDAWNEIEKFIKKEFEIEGEKK